MTDKENEKDFDGQWYVGKSAFDLCGIYVVVKQSGVSGYTYGILEMSRSGDGTIAVRLNKSDDNEYCALGVLKPFGNGVYTLMPGIAGVDCVYDSDYYREINPEYVDKGDIAFVSGEPYHITGPIDGDVIPLEEIENGVDKRLVSYILRLSAPKELGFYRDNQGKDWAYTKNGWVDLETLINEDFWTLSSYVIRDRLPMKPIHFEDGKK